MKKLLLGTFKSGIVKEFITVIILNIFYLFFTGSVGKFLGQGILNNKIFIVSISFVVSLITYSIYSLVKFLTKPICLSTKIINIDTEETTYLKQGDINEKNEMQIDINISNVDSVWKKIAFWYLNKKNIFMKLEIEDNKRSVILLPKYPYSDEYQILPNGFSYDISIGIFNNLKYNNNLEYKIRFTANINRDIEQVASVNCKYELIPKIEVENSCDLIIKKMIKFSNLNTSPFRIVYKRFQ